MDLCLEQLFNRGCSPNLVNVNGMTASMAAAYSGNVKCLVLLWQHGADFNVRDRFNLTTACCAVIYDQLKCLHFILGTLDPDPN